MVLVLDYGFLGLGSDYVWPQYSLPQNQFFTRIQEEPYYLSNTLRNQNARLIASPLSFDANTQLFLAPVSGSTCPVLPPTSSATGTGSSEYSHKNFTTKVPPTVDTPFYSLIYTYNYVGTISCLSINSSQWLIFQFNLARTTNNSIQSVVVSGDSDCSVSNVSGSIVLGGLSPAIYITNPINSDNCPVSGNSNTIYKVYGNLIMIAVEFVPPSTLDQTITSLNYNITVSVSETPRPTNPLLNY